MSCEKGFPSICNICVGVIPVKEMRELNRPRVGVGAADTNAHMIRDSIRTKRIIFLVIPICFLFVDLGFRFPDLLHGSVMLRVKEKRDQHHAGIGSATLSRKHHLIAGQFQSKGEPKNFINLPLCEHRRTRASLFAR